MGEIIVRKVRGMNWTARISLVLIFTLVFSTFMYQGWYAPKSVQAAITTQQAWTSVYQGTGFPGTYSYTVNAGSNRMLVVAVATAITANATQTVTVTYGGQSLTQQVGDGGTSARQHSYLFYLKDTPSVMNGSAQNLVVTVSGGTSSYNNVFAAVYAGVDQSATPISDSKQYTSGTGITQNPAFAAALTIGAGERAVEIVNLMSSSSTTVRTITGWATNWSQGIASTGVAAGTSSQQGYVGLDTTAGSTTSQHTLSSANTWASMSGMSLKVYTCSDPDPSTITIPAAQTANGSPYNAAALKTTTGDVGSFEYRVMTVDPPATFATYAITDGTNGNTATSIAAGSVPPVNNTTTVNGTLNGSNYTAISAEGGTNYGINGGWGDTEAMQLALTIAQTPATITSIDVTVSGWGAAAANVNQYIWNKTTSAWVAIGPVAFTTVDQTFTTNYVGNFSDFVDASNKLYLQFVYTATFSNDPSFDFFSVRVNYDVPATVCTNWTSNASIPATTAGGSLCGDYTNGGTYTLDVRGTDPDCATSVTTTPANFTWNACSETATVAVTEPIASPISLPTSISATLGGSGGSNAEVSDDNATWHASPWTYTPPGPNQSGTVTFYARATGSCGTITDPTPVTVNYDTTNPTVTSTTPSNGATGIALNSAVTINWSENIDCTTVNTTNITISPAVGWVRTSCSGGQAVFTPSGQANNTAYTVTVGTGVKDTLGTNMAASYPFTYTTVLAAPTVGSINPNSGAQDTSLTIQINGTNFVSGATVAFSGAGISITGTTFVNASRIDVTITISAAAATGARDVTVMNPDAQSATLTNGFTVTPGTCVRNVPTVSLGSNGSAAPGGSMVYTLTATNADNSFCGNSTFALGISSETGNTGSFTLPSVLGSATTGALAPGASYNTTFTVTAQGGATFGHTLTSNVSATDGSNHAGQPGSGSVVTSISNPWANNSLLHNSINMTANGSTKNYWSGQGGWGITGGVYGGFMCDTCHTRSTTNISRIKQSITVPDTSKGNIPGGFGSPVSFQSKSGTTNGFGDDQTSHATSTRICEVCHTLPAKHKYNEGSVNLHENEPSSPANNYQDCITCHEHKKGFALPGCIDCHAKQQGNRAAVVGQFSGNSHHIQGVDLSNTHCYQCHWEANANGSINYTYHLGWRNGLVATSNAAIDLVVWNATTRPAAYTVGTTAVQYNIVAGAAWRTTELPKINSHCIGCHDTPNDAIQPFGDGKTPKQYAWDGTSVGARYSQAGTTTWGKYTNTVTYPNAATKNVTKAYSAHGNAAANQRGWNTTTGYDSTPPNTSGSVQVLCYDCHNSHGSTVAGTTTSYAAGSGVTNGGILKDTTSGLGGYSVTYKPATNAATTATRVKHNAGAGLCFDCHLTSNAMGGKPWSYDVTFGSSQILEGYVGKPGWAGATGVNPSGAQQRYAYKNLIPSRGSHFEPSSALTHGSAPAASTINGLCTPCHDPHGVTTNTALISAANKPYALPLLKGTWMTSPYKEDTAPLAMNLITGQSSENRTGCPDCSFNSPYNQRSAPGYHIDQNTFSTTNLTANPPNWDWNITTTHPQPAEAVSQFGGLCLNCHAQANINPNSSTVWKSFDRIHNTVKGWGGVGANANNAVHAFTCSKCHTPHHSSLPRLMISNCVDYKHRGRVASGGTAGNFEAPTPNPGRDGAGRGRYPSGGGGHGNNPMDNGPYYFGETGTGSDNTRPPLINCHNVAGAGGTGYPDSQLWNQKTPW